MADHGGLARVLSKQDFNPENFVSKLAEGPGGESDLLVMKQKVQILSDETAHSLKKNVYKNYFQFIETAKEISILEGEMYQLSHTLTEQKSLMSSMMEMSLVSDKAIVEEPKEQEQENPEEETRKNLAFLLEKVEGCSSVTEVPGRHLVHNSDLAELDAESFMQIQRVHSFLLNDSLMIATWLPNRRGPVRYRFQGLYELDSLAVVNVRDAGPVKNAFKILMFPDSKMYQADSAKAKRQWLDILEETKKRKASRDKQKKEAAIFLAEQQAVASATPTEDSNPFGEEDDSEALAAIETDFLNSDWLQELPEDLDMCIAQRDFEGAVDLVERVNEYLKDCPKVPAVKEFRARIDHRVKQLTEGLMGELQVSPERSLRGGPRAARRAVMQLIRLGKSAQACDLFLKNRSSIIKYNIRQLKFEGATTLYIRRLCDVFIPCLSETGKEFMKAFQEHYGCMSAFVVWAKKELQMFVSTVNRQVFGGKSSLSVITECLHNARKQCEELSQIGLDVNFIFESLIATDLERVIRENKDQIIEGVKYRAQDDKWRPMNHLSHTDCLKFVEEISTAGLDLKNYIYDACFINLTMNTANFSKSCLSFANAVLLVHTPEIDYLITDSISEIFRAEITHIEDSIRNKIFYREHKFILKNAQFVLEVIMSKIEAAYKERAIVFPKHLLDINGEYRRLKSVVKSLGAS
ncbi:exocyst complex component 8-like [Pecten maximus]|uniref:exocyst complex component 8-like n=1 Tax=Pecten maximus TaxID=6579 RepID=UPI0014589BE4|nr:exocyst complex component 8-like [Pecten maximus]